MVYLKDIGFVIKRINFGEADRYVTIFTQENGKIETKALGVRKISSRRSSSIELLNLIRFHAVKSSKNFILTEIELLNSFEKRKDSLKQCEIGFLVCELIDNLCPMGQVNRELFERVNTFLRGNENDHDALLSFETDILTNLGYWDTKRKFKTEEEVRHFIESIIEKKIKSPIIGNFG